MREHDFLDAISNIDDDILARSIELRDAAMKKSGKRRRLLVGLISAALCLAVVIVFAFPVRIALIDGEYEDGVLIMGSVSNGDSDSSEPMPPPMPWDNSIYIKAYTDTARYEPGEPVIINFEAALNNGYLGDGALRVSIDAADFNIEIDGTATDTLLIENFTEASYSDGETLRFSAVLSPEFASRLAHGEISVKAEFVFDDEQAFRDKLYSELEEYILDEALAHIDGGCVSINYNIMTYAADRIELRLDGRGSSFSSLCRLLKDHYRTWRISAQEFSDLYFEAVFADRICVEIPVRATDRIGFRFQYFSKNIRYESADYCYDVHMLELCESAEVESDTQLKREAARELAEYMLSYMKGNGIISNEEYLSEFKWLDSIENVQISSIGFSGELGYFYIRTLERHMLTH